MSRSLVGQVTRRAVGTLVVALAVAGLGTAGVLHAQTVSGLDRALLAAAFGEAHPWSEERWTNSHRHAPAEVARWEPGAGPVDDGIAERVIASGEPTYFDLPDERVLLFPVTEADGGGVSQLVVVRAPAIELLGSVGPFLLAWVLTSAVVAVAASMVLRRLIHEASEPLEVVSEALAHLPLQDPSVRVPPGGVVEVDRVIDSVNTLLDRLEAALTQQRRFTAEAAHELRTPVTVLAGELDLALRRPRDAAAYREALVRAQEETTRLAQLVESLMALARVDAGQVEVSRAPEHLSDLLHGALAAEADRLRDAGCSVALVLETDGEVRGHPGLLGLALSNLLRNVAVHAPGAEVVVRSRRVEGGIEVCVDDDGPGIAPADRERVFERFHRRSTARDSLGLGLPLAREVVRRHGGDVVVGVSPEGGCRVAVTLPTTSGA